MAELRVIDDGAQPPTHNMAVDEALLDAELSWLRLYAWQPHALSLGYFQCYGDFRAETDGLACVRRLTGGGAILHSYELTLSLAVDASLMPADVRRSYRVVNDAVAAAVAEHGVALSAPTAATGAHAAWCFARPTGLDLVDPTGAKVFGSAQRRRRGRVLHHGSLVLHRDARAPFTGEVGNIDEPALRSSLARHIGAALGLAPRAAALEPELLERARVLEGRYASRGWTQRR